MKKNLGKEIYALRLALSYVQAYVLDYCSKPLEMLTVEELLHSDLLSNLQWTPNMIREGTTYHLPWLCSSEKELFKQRVNDFTKYGYDGLVREQLLFELSATDNSDIDKDEIDSILKKKWKFTEKPGADQSMISFSHRVTSMGRLLSKSNNQCRRRRIRTTADHGRD